MDDEAELEQYARQIGDYIVQPFVDGNEYTIDIFCDWDGNPVSVIPRERLQVRAGEVLKTRIDMDAAMIGEAKALCRCFRPRGPLTVQLIRDRAGVDWFIEINPRYGGGAPLSMKAGARSAETVLHLLDREPLGGNPEIADQAVYSRFDQSVCIREGKTAVQGIILDLDDTLYSEKEYIRSGFRAVSDYLGGGMEETLFRFFQEKKPALDEVLRLMGREEEKEKVLSVYREHLPDIHLYPGVPEMIAEWKEKGIRVGIITDGRPEGQRAKLRALGLDGIVDDIIITDELGGVQFRKPCDIAFRIIRERWRLPYSTLLYVGDNPAKDFQAPRQLGMKSVWFDNSDGLYSADPDCGYERIGSIDELRDLIRT